MARFMRKGITKVFYVTGTVTLAAPTAAQVNAGVDLSGEVNEITGFGFTNNPIMTPDLGTAFVSQIPGEDTTADSGMKMYEEKANSTVRSALVKGDDGYVVIFPKGIAGATPAAGDVCEVWPVTISSNTRLYSAGNEAAMYEVKYACTAIPNLSEPALA